MLHVARQKHCPWRGIGHLAPAAGEKASRIRACGLQAAAAGEEGEPERQKDHRVVSRSVRHPLCVIELRPRVAAVGAGDVGEGPRGARRVLRVVPAEEVVEQVEAAVLREASLEEHEVALRFWC